MIFIPSAPTIPWAGKARIGISLAGNNPGTGIASSSGGSNGAALRTAGFTLLELIVVLFIMAILLAVVPPLVSGASGTAELKGAARQMAAALRYARSQAIAQNREVAVWLDVEKKQYWLAETARKISLPEKLGVRIDAAKSEFRDEKTGAIRFFSDGSSTGGRVTLSTGKRSYQVEVNWLIGQVSVNEQG